MTDIFISYSRRDTDFVRVLHEALSRSKYEAWVDWQDIPLTADWWREIQHGIEAADTFVFVISPDSLASKVCAQEVEHASRHNKRMVPIVRREGFDGVFMHESLSRHNWLYFRREDDFDRAFQSLVKAINMDLPYVRSHTRLLTRALEWEHHQRRDDLLLRGQDLEEAEEWLHQAEAEQTEPLASEQHRAYIRKSREAEAANQRLLEAGARARRRVRLGSVVLGLTLMGAALVGWQSLRAFRRLHQAQVQASLTEANTAFAANRYGLEPLMLALKAGSQLESLRLVRGREELRSQLRTSLLQSQYWIAEQDRLQGHSDDVLSVAISPDGSRYVTTSADNTAILWSAAGQQLAQLEAHGDWVREARFSPDGQLIATTSDDTEDNVCFWSAAGELQRCLTAHDDWVYSLDFSPDGQRFATASEDGTVRLWTLAGELLITLEADSDLVRTVRFAADGRFVTAGSDGIIRIWGPGGNPLGTRSGHTDAVTQLAFSPDGQLASTSRDGTVKIWSLDSGTVRTLAPPTDGFGNRSELWAVDFSADGQWLAAGSRDAKIHIWWQGGSRVATLDSHQDRIRALCFGPDGRTLLSTADDNTARRWQWPNPAMIPLKLHEDAVYAAAFSGDGKRLGLASRDGTLSLWNHAGRYLGTRSLEEDVTAVGFAPDGSLTAAAADGRVGLWRADRAVPEFFQAHELAVRSLRYSPDGRLATASDDGSVKLWPAPGTASDSRGDPQVFQGHAGPVYSVDFGPGGQLLTAGEDGQLLLWNAETGSQTPLAQLDAPLFNARFSPDGSRIVSGGEDGVPRLWDSDGRELARLEGHSAPVWGVAFSPDGRYIATASDDRTIRLWQADGSFIITLQGHSDEVNSVAFSPDSRQLVSTSWDGTALIWRMDDLSLQGLMAAGCDWFTDGEGGYRIEAVTPLCSP